MSQSTYYGGVSTANATWLSSVFLQQNEFSGPQGKNYCQLGWWCSRIPLLVLPSCLVSLQRGGEYVAWQVGECFPWMLVGLLIYPPPGASGSAYVVRTTVPSKPPLKYSLPQSPNMIWIQPTFSLLLIIIVHPPCIFSYSNPSCSSYLTPGLYTSCSLCNIVLSLYYFT